jgi:hypothetical protein
LVGRPLPPDPSPPWLPNAGAHPPEPEPEVGINNAVLPAVAVGIANAVCVCTFVNTNIPAAVSYADRATTAPMNAFFIKKEICKFVKRLSVAQGLNDRVYV